MPEGLFRYNCVFLWRHVGPDGIRRGGCQPPRGPSVTRSAGCLTANLPHKLEAIPGHPLRWVSLQLPGMPPQLGEVAEGIGSIQLASVDQDDD